MAFFSANIVASCATAYISASKCITAVRSVHPPRTEFRWGVGNNNKIEAVWELNWGITVGKAGAVATESGSVAVSVISFLDEEGGSDDGSSK